MQLTATLDGFHHQAKWNVASLYIRIPILRVSENFQFQVRAARLRLPASGLSPLILIPARAARSFIRAWGEDTSRLLTNA